MLYGAINFPVRPILKELETISGLGFDYLELAMDPPKAHYTIVRQQKDALLGALDRSNLALVCHLPTFVSTADLTESLRAASLNEVIKSLELAAELGSIKVVLHPGFISGMGAFVMDEARQYALESLQFITETAGQLGLTLCIENMFPRSNSLVNPEDFVEIFERFPGLKMTLDTGHANIDGKGGRKLIEFIDRFHDRIDHVHANDNFGKEDNHLPIGAGTVDFPRVVQSLKKVAYDATITLEVFSRDKDYVKISRDKLDAMFDGGRPGRVS